MDFKVMDNKALLTALILNNPKLSTKKVLQIYGLSKALEIMNTRELKTIFSTRSWQRIITETQVEILEIESPLYKIRYQIVKTPIISTEFI